MAEVTGLRNNALPYPIYGVPFGIVFPMLDADGDLVTGATTPDAERSLNCDTFADCTNESTEIATNSGVYYLLLTGAEMTADVVTVIAKSATAGMKTTVITLYPRKLVALRAATAAGGAAGSITLDASASAVDDFYNGCVVVGVLDSATEARIITDYVGSTKVASVTPNWNTTPDSDDTFTIYMPEGMQINQANVTHVASTAQTAGDIIGDTNDIQARLPAALVSGRIDASVGAMAANVLTATAINADAITAAKIADGAIDAATLATGTITAAKFAAGAIDAAAIADGAIDAATLATGTITAAKFAAGAIDAAAIANGAIDAATFAAGAIDAAAIANGAIDAATFAAGAIDAAALAADAGTEIGTAVWATTTRVLTASTNLGDLDDAVLAVLGTPSNLGGGATLAANLADIEGQTDDIGVAGAGLTALASAANLATVAGYIDTEIGTLQTSVNDIPTNAELATALASADDAVLAAIAALSIPTVAQILTTAMTESYAANGAAPTLAQCLFAIHQHLMTRSLSGTTATVKKLDNSTTAFLETLNDATNPTAVSRA